MEHLAVIIAAFASFIVGLIVGRVVFLIGGGE